MANMASHQNRIIAYKPGKFKVCSNDQENFPLIALNTSTFAKFVNSIEPGEAEVAFKDTQKYIEDIRNHDVFYGNLALGTCMTEFSVGFFKINRGVFFGIERIGSFGFFTQKLYPSYVEEKLGIAPIEAAPIADFLNFYLDIPTEIFGDYKQEFMR